MVINISTSPKSQTFTFSNDSVAHVMRYTTSGMHTVRFDGTDLTSGIYFYRLQAADQVITRKMMFIK